MKTIVSALREGAPLYLLPDMNFGPEESIFVPFYGVPAATVPSLVALCEAGARQGGAGDDAHDARRLRGAGAAGLGRLSHRTTWRPTRPCMNQRLQDYIDAMPDQYYWVHKRFKTRPPGEPPVY